MQPAGSGITRFTAPKGIEMQTQEDESLPDLHVVWDQGSLSPEVVGASCPAPAAASQRDERQISGKNYGRTRLELLQEVLEAAPCWEGVAAILREP